MSGYRCGSGCGDVEPWSEAQGLPARFAAAGTEVKRSASGASAGPSIARLRYIAHVHLAAASTFATPVFVQVPIDECTSKETAREWVQRFQEHEDEKRKLRCDLDRLASNLPRESLEAVIVFVRALKGRGAAL